MHFLCTRPEFTAWIPHPFLLQSPRSPFEIPMSVDAVMAVGLLFFFFFCFPPSLPQQSDGFQLSPQENWQCSRLLRVLASLLCSPAAASLQP